MLQDRPIVFTCVTCDVAECLPLDPSLPDLARRFVTTHADCVTTLDLYGVSLLRRLVDAS